MADGATWATLLPGLTALTVLDGVEGADVTEQVTPFDSLDDSFWAVFLADFAQPVGVNVLTAGIRSDGPLTVRLTVRLRSAYGRLPVRLRAAAGRLTGG